MQLVVVLFWMHALLSTGHNFHPVALGIVFICRRQHFLLFPVIRSRQTINWFMLYEQKWTISSENMKTSRFTCIFLFPWWCIFPYLFDRFDEYLIAKSSHHHNNCLRPQTFLNLKYLTPVFKQSGSPAGALNIKWCLVTGKLSSATIWRHLLRIHGLSVCMRWNCSSGDMGKTWPAHISKNLVLQPVQFVGTLPCSILVNPDLIWYDYSTHKSKTHSIKPIKTAN